MTTTYLVVTAGGAVTQADTYEAAVAHARRLGCAEVGHSGDLADGGDRTLCWATAADARDDDGRKALATIRLAAQ